MRVLSSLLRKQLESAVLAGRRASEAAARASIEGLGVFAAGSESLEWPGGDLWLVILLVAYVVLSRLAVATLRRGSGPGRPAAVPAD